MLVAAGCALLPLFVTLILGLIDNSNKMAMTLVPLLLLLVIVLFLALDNDARMPIEH